jgi:membrane protease YdiL (CAAX protease family)
MTLHGDRDHWFAALAPLTVVVALEVLHSAFVVFAVYHVGLCLVLPAWLTRRAGGSWRQHLRTLGLLDAPPGRTWPRAAALTVLGAAAAVAVVLAWSWLPGLFPDRERIAAALATWGVGAAGTAPLLLLIAVLNGPAEEAFWRGWLERRPARSSLGPGLRAVLFTSYHVTTVGALAPDFAAASAMLAIVLLAAVAWTWSRRRWGTLWPAVAMHTGATLGYVAVCRAIMA